MRMRAVVHTAFGDPVDVLQLREVAIPSVGPGEALVRVEAAGVAKGDWLTTRGIPYIARPMYGLRAPRQSVAGHSFAGVVEAVGAGTQDVAAGDEVFGIHHGALADLVAVPETAMVRKPDAVSFEKAAAVPVPGITALQAVRDAARVQPGHRVLVIGASGAVGSCTVQIAKAMGAHVTGVASTRNLPMLRIIGADDVIDYTRETVVGGASRYDAIIDIAGNRPVARLRRALDRRGTLVIVGGTGGNWTMGFGRTVRAMILAPFVQHRLVGLLSHPNQRDLRELADLMDAGTLVPVVDTTFPFRDAPRAVDFVGAGRGRGAVVVSV